MREKRKKEEGFSIWELMVTLFLLLLLLSYLYPTLLWVERTERESRIYTSVLLWMDEETERWRRGGNEKEKEREIEGVKVRQRIVRREEEEGLLRVIFFYEWSVNGKTFTIRIEMERFIPDRFP
ncbi:hypothetical protein CULT_2070003 [[Clostridium] ultunense Esp]|nr:hypothetical protein CULT_2070003 [[Clostridium] ultunense Esp]